MKDNIDTLTDLLLGAAYADKRLEGREMETIRALLERVTAQSPLPESVEARIRDFNPAKHDPIESAKSLRFLSLEDRRTVADLLVWVIEADEEIDLDEDAYIRKVAHALALSEEDIKEVTLEVIEDEKLDGLLKD